MGRGGERKRMRGGKRGVGATEGRRWREGGRKGRRWREGGRAVRQEGGREEGQCCVPI